VYLLIVLVLVTLVLFAIFLGGGLVAQGYLYQAPAERFAARAVGAAALVGSFISLWVLIDQRQPRKYDTFFEFAPYATQEFDEFDAVRWTVAGGKLRTDESGKPSESSVNHKRGSGSKSKAFFEEGTGAEFKINSTSYMTAAITLKPAPDAEPIRLDARMKKEGAGYVYTKDLEGRRFEEKNGSRYVLADQMGTLFVPSRATVVLALLINFVHFVVWFIAFWPILQFTRGYAFIFAVSFGVFTMLLVMPLLFKPNRETKPAAEPPQVASMLTGIGSKESGVRV
jgi:hypothetical protein